MMMRVAIRGYVSGRLLFEDRADVDSAKMDALLPALAEKHAVAMATHKLHMIEIEFLDDPDPEARFFRFGTDPPGMVIPFRIDLE
jgi:hypothetical protein